MSYTDLLLRLLPLNDAKGYYPVEVELSDGSRFTGGQLKLDTDQLLSLQQDTEGYGLALFNALFPEGGEIRRAYDKATGIAEAESEGNLRVRLWVDNAAVELHAFPWERLYHLHKGKTLPLAASAQTPLSRYTSLEIREPQPITDVPVKVLVALSNPEKLPGDLAPANVDLEVESLRRALDGLRQQGQVQVTLMPGRTGLSAALRSRLEGEGYKIVDGPVTLFSLAPQLLKAHVFHFIGHGAFKSGANGGTAALYLEKADGSWQAVRDDDIVSMLTALGTLPQLFFLVACESAKRTPGATSPFVGLGPKLVQAGVPAVVAMQEQVPVELARTLSSEFYARLAEHGEVDRAINQARLRVFDKKSTDWAIPVLFMRIRGGRLFGVDAEADAPAPGVPPFKGLEFFTENDADKFYGRELLTAKLAGRLRSSRFLPIIIGSSGSGKSSVIRAGLLPALRRGEGLADGTLTPEGSRTWPVHVVVPAASPLAALAAELTREDHSTAQTETLASDLRVDERALHFFARKRLSQRQNANRLLLIIDQFEEVFTLCKDEDERRAFINNLIYASATDTDGPTIVIIIFRADFYAHCAQYANLRVAVSTNQEFVGPMSPEELRRSIEEPAKAGRWEFEPGLVDLILKEVGDEPGALPLMQHALLETWKRRRARTMTLRGYNEAGGIRGAIAQTAEAVYVGLPAEQQPIARRIFLRLVELGEGTQDTRRRAQLTELWPRADMQPAISTVLKKLVDSRLVVTTDKTAEVAHEALIREWPTLRRWIDESREALRLQRELNNDIRQWENLGRDESGLYKSVRLARALEWLTRNNDDASEVEREFLTLGQAAAEREAQEKEAQRQRELESAQRIAEAAQKVAEEQKQRAAEQARAALRQKRLSYVIGAVGVVAVILAIAALFAFGQANDASAKAQAASTQAVAQQNVAQVASTQAVAQQQIAEVASTHAVEQQQVAVAQAATAQAASTQAFEQKRNADFQRIIADAVQSRDLDPELASLLLGEAVDVRAGQITTDEATSYGTVNLLFNTTLEQRVRLTLGDTQNSSPIYSAIYSPDGKLIATTGADQRITLWDAVTGAIVQQFSIEHTEPINGLAFSADGQFIGSASLDNTAKIWDVATGAVRFTLPHTFSLYSIRYLATGDGYWITSGVEGRPHVWSVQTGELLRILQDPDIPVSTAWDLAVSPNGRLFGTAHSDKLVRLWGGGLFAKLNALVGSPGEVTALAFSADSVRVVTGGKSGNVRLWTAGGGLVWRVTPHSSRIYSLAYSRDGRYIAAASQDGTVSVLSPFDGREVFRFANHKSNVYSVDFSPDSRYLLSAGEDGLARVWDISDEGSLARLTFAQTERQIFSLNLSPDGRYLAAAGQDKIVQIWDTTTGALSVTIQQHGDFINALAFSPDGHWLATGSDKLVRVWDWTHDIINPTAVFAHNDLVTTLTAHPKGGFLASGSADRSVRVWNLTTGKRQLLLANLPRSVTSLQYNPTGQQLFGAFLGYTATLWSAINGAQQFVLTNNDDGIEQGAFSPDGTRLATYGEGGVITIWDTTVGEKAGSAFTGQGGQVRVVQFSPDGHWLASGGSDRFVYIWDVATGRILLRLPGHQAEINALAFAPDSQQIFSADLNGRINRYVINTVQLVQFAEETLTRPLLPSECQTYLGVETCPTAVP